MTNSGVTTFRRQSSVFQVLIAGGIVGLAMFVFSHIFEAPLQAQAEFKADAVQAAVSQVSLVIVQTDYDVTPETVVQSWPPQTPLGDGIPPALHNLSEHLCGVGLSGVIPPPALAFILPASASLHHSIIKFIRPLIKENAMSLGAIYAV